MEFVPPAEVCAHVFILVKTFWSYEDILTGPSLFSSTFLGLRLCLGDRHLVVIVRVRG